MNEAYLFKCHNLWDFILIILDKNLCEVYIKFPS